MGALLGRENLLECGQLLPDSSVESPDKRLAEELRYIHGMKKHEILGFSVSLTCHGV